MNKRKEKRKRYRSKKKQSIKEIKQNAPDQNTINLSNSVLSEEQKRKVLLLYQLQQTLTGTRFAKTLQNSPTKLDILLIQNNNKNQSTLKSRVMNQLLTKITFHLVNLLLRQIHTNNFIDLNQVQTIV